MRRFPATGTRKGDPVGFIGMSLPDRHRHDLNPTEGFPEGSRKDWGNDSTAFHLVVVNSHPIQYFAPMYGFLSRLLDGKLTVIYASEKGLTDSLDSGFETRFRWDVDLLSGYRSVFLREAVENANRDTNRNECDTLLRVLDQERPSHLVIHGYSDPVARAALRWTRRARCRVMMRGDTWEGKGEIGWWLRRRTKRMLLRRWFLNSVNCFLAVGQRNARYWEGIANGRPVMLVPYGLDRRAFAWAPREERLGARRKLLDEVQAGPVLGFFGKLIEKKGIVQLMEFLRSRGEGFPSATLLVVGDGPCMERLRDAIPRGWAACFMGFRNQRDLPGMYRACDLVMVPSLRVETWGFVVQEASACGVPVLASDAVGCVPDLVAEGKNGWVLPTGHWRHWVEFLTAFVQGDHRLREEDLRECSRKVPAHEDSARALMAAVSCIA
jgi:glycosyltransferase involved in cell wall biosynthesis